MTLRKHIVLVAAFLLAGLSGWAQQALRGVVKDAVTGEPVPGAAITQGKYWALTDSLGTFQLKAPQNGELTITCLGYKTLKTRPLSSYVYRLQPDIFALQEVVVTAQENHGLTSASKIGADAIAHIQPSSIADVLELLPGGTSSNPVLGTPQIVNLRAAGSLSSDYATSALGTQFTIDGKPLNNNANLQYTPAWSELGSNYVNLGTDMRTIGTEDIESINVVRGIASVEHGDLTSGLIQVKRIKGGNDFRARFKSDMTSKLVYAGKGWEWGGKDRRTLNVSVNFLDARSDPRNVRQNYKRLTGSLRFGRTWSGGEHFTQTVNTSLDYTGSFDNRKSDQDIDQLDGIPTETYKSTYNRFQLGADYHLQAKDNDAFFRSLAVNASLSYEKDLIDRWKNVILSSETPFSTAKEPGEYDAYMLPMRYEATLQVDGQPLYVFTSAVAQFQVKEHKFKVGADWNYDKNLGQGSIFDITRPLSTTMGSRPRAYYDIPADNQLALFLQENSRLKLGSFALEWMAGVRMSMLLGHPGPSFPGSARQSSPGDAGSPAGRIPLQQRNLCGSGASHQVPYYGDAVSGHPLQRQDPDELLAHGAEPPPHQYAPFHNGSREQGPDAGPELQMGSRYGPFLERMVLIGRFLCGRYDLRLSRRQRVSAADCQGLRRESD